MIDILLIDSDAQRSLSLAAIKSMMIWGPLDFRAKGAATLSR